MHSTIIKPVVNNERLDNLDVIRGVALLGILLMNIQAFAMTFSAYSNPTSYGDLTGINFIIYYFSHVFADQKFMTIFSTLFGVGIILMADNIEAKRGLPKRVHYKRMFILAVLGLLHAYFLWFGDILFAYAFAGVIVYGARNKSIKFLLVFAFCLVTICSLMMLLVGLSLPYLSAEELAIMNTDLSPTDDFIAQEQLANIGSWFAQADQRYRMALEMQQNLAFYLPRIVGLMMVGMALYKLGFFAGKYKNNTLIVNGIFALMLALVIIISGVEYNFAVNWSLESMFIGIQFNYWGSILMAYGYLCLLVVFCRAQSGQWLKHALASVGRMALTNYLLQSLFCGFIFYGWGLGLFGSTQRWEQFAIVICIWLLQLILSTWWMSRFQFGPIEWLLRSATYAKVQPMQKYKL
jgi:uncharacterized protein